MKNLFKKTLACCLVVCMVLTLCISALTVNAEAVTGTVTVGTADITTADKTATVDVTVAANPLAAAEVVVNVPADLTIAGLAFTADDSVEITYAPAANPTGKPVALSEATEFVAPDVVDGKFTYIIHLPANTTTANAVVLSITFAGTFAEGKIDVAVASAEACYDAESDLIALTFVPGAINVASAHVCEFVGTVTQAPTCTVPGVKTYACTCGEGTYTEEIPVIPHTEETIAAVDATCTTAGATAGVKCSVCDTVLTAPTTVDALGHAWVDGDITYTDCTSNGNLAQACSRCDATQTVAVDPKGHTPVAYEEVPATCTTVGYTGGKYCSAEGCGAVIEARTEIPVTGHTYENSKTYMNKETYTWHKDCAICGTPTDVDANVITGKLIAAKIVCLDKVGANITINRAATNGLSTLGYADYYVEVAYQYYGDGYALKDGIYKRTSSQYDFLDNNGKVDGFTFTEIALYEMGYEFTINLYCLDAEGDVIATISTTTSIPALALVDMEKYKTDTKLLKSLTDMLNYGAAIQEFFAKKNQGTDIANAELPNKGFEEYIEAYGSSREDLPETFNTTLTKTPIKEGTTIAVGNPVLKTEASNSISYTIKANAEYDETKLKVVATYTDGYGNLVKDEVNFTELVEGVQGNNRVYTYIFSKLALFDVRKTVNITIYYDGVAEYSCDYCASNYTQKYMNNADMGDSVVALELFTQSLSDKLFN